MWKRLGCSCCDTEESYDLDTTPVYDFRKKDTKTNLGYAENKAYDNIDSKVPKELSEPKATEGKHNPGDTLDNLSENTGVETKPDTSPVKTPDSRIPEIVIDDTCIEEDISVNLPPVIIDQSPLTPDLTDSTDAEEQEPETEMANNVVPKITEPAPDFCGQAVVKGTFKEIKLSDYKGKYLVFFFYPLDFTFVCPTEIIAYSDRAEEFRNIGCEVVACSTDSHFCHLAWVNTPRKQGGLGEMDIPLLSDKNCSIAKSYGVYKEDEGVTFRGLFIIDGSGNLRQVTINDLPVGRSVDETLRLVQAFQFTDKHGEVCPAGWKPGQKTMKADPKGSKEYFASKN